MLDTLFLGGGCGGGACDGKALSTAGVDGGGMPLVIYAGVAAFAEMAEGPVAAAAAAAAAAALVAAVAVIISMASSSARNVRSMVEAREVEEEALPGRLLLPLLLLAFSSPRSVLVVVLD